MRWKHNFAGIFRAFRKHDVHHLRDDIARTANDDFIANTQPQTLDFISVMQRCVTDQHPGNLDRLKAGDGRNRPGTSNLKLNIAYESHLLLRRELKGHSPARRAGNKAQLLLQRHRVDFDHHAIDIKSQRWSVFFNLVIVSKYFLRGVAKRHSVAYRQAPLFKLQQAAQMGIWQHAAFQHTNAIAEESKRSLRCDTRIELA